MCARASASQFLPHNSAALQFQALVSMQMHAAFLDEKIGKPICLGWGTGWWSGGVGGASGGSSPKSVHAFLQELFSCLLHIRWIYMVLAGPTYASFKARNWISIKGKFPLATNMNVPSHITSYVSSHAQALSAENGKCSRAEGSTLKPTCQISCQTSCSSALDRKTAIFLLCFYIWASEFAGQHWLR